MEACGSFRYFHEAIPELPPHPWKLSLLPCKLVEASDPFMKAYGSFQYFHEVLEELLRLPRTLPSLRWA